MRHEHLLLNDADSQAVIEEVNAWCRRTGTNYNKLVTAARVNPTTRSGVRNRGKRLAVSTAQKLRMAMAAYPNGIDKGSHKARVRRSATEYLDSQRARQARNYPAIVRVDRSECKTCGARRDIGCEHWARFEFSAYA